jgi:hypothetical protein
MVELNEGFSDDDAAKPRVAVEGEDRGVSAASEGEEAAPAFAPMESAGPAQPGSALPAPAQPQLTPLGSQEDGVKRAGAILAAATQARWPMYLRNVKQILRNAEGGFDDRRYGFGGLMDLLKACQRAGLVRIERDRRGGLRVFQGGALQGTGGIRPTHGVLPQPDIEDTLDATPSDSDAQPTFAEPPQPAELSDEDGNEIQPVLIDTTAELLGRAAPKARARTARSSSATTTRTPRGAKAAAKPATRRTRAKKAAAGE